MRVATIILTFLIVVFLFGVASGQTNMGPGNSAQGMMMHPAMPNSMTNPSRGQGGAAQVRPAVAPQTWPRDAARGSEGQWRVVQYRVPGTNGMCREVALFGSQSFNGGRAVALSEMYRCGPAR